MKLDMRLVGLATGGALTFLTAAQAYGDDISINHLRNYFTSNSVAADPGVMVILGIGLIALRVLIARRSKRREKNPAHP